MEFKKCNGPKGIRTPVTDVRVPSGFFCTDSHGIRFNELEIDIKEFPSE